MTRASTSVVATLIPRGRGTKYTGQFWLPPKHNVLSVLHCQAAPPAGGETGFADLRAAYATLSGPLKERAAGASIVASVRDIADFAKGDPEDLDRFPDAEHKIVQPHALDGGPTLYVRFRVSPSARAEEISEKL